MAHGNDINVLKLFQVRAFFHTHSNNKFTPKIAGPIFHALFCLLKNNVYLNLHAIF